MAIPVREHITVHDMVTPLANPLGHVDNLNGVRVHDVGQGDSISVWGSGGNRSLEVVRFDYGGRERAPFHNPTEVDHHLPVAANTLLMLSHWDEDHWCAGKKGNLAKQTHWLVPRQITSPRAVRFSTTLEKIECIPEHLAKTHQFFKTKNGDRLWWEKIGRYPGRFYDEEDCNSSGVAMALERRTARGSEVILLPGDAAFDQISLFHMLEASGSRLRGIVAYHHGSRTHWNRTTERLLTGWRKAQTLDMVFSCSDPSSYDHPHDQNYINILPQASFHYTSQLRSQGHTFKAIHF